MFRRRWKGGWRWRLCYHWRSFLKLFMYFYMVVIWIIWDFLCIWTFGVFWTLYCILIIIKTQLYIFNYIFDIYVINTRLPAGTARLKNGRVATKNYARKCGRGFVNFCPRVDFMANTRGYTRPSPPMNTSTMNRGLNFPRAPKRTTLRMGDTRSNTRFPTVNSSDRRFKSE